MSKRRTDRKLDAVLDRIDQGRKLLAAWGVHDGSLPQGTPAADVLRVLEPLIGRDPATDLAIAEWLGAITVPAAAERLAAWEPSAGKELKREIRRSIFRLEQKGIRVRRAEEPKPAFSLRPEKAEPEGYLGPVDGEGARMAWLIRREAGRARGLFAVISDREGMVHLDSGIIAADKLDEALQDAERDGSRLNRAPWPYVDALMHAAFRASPPRRGSMQGEYLLDRAEVTGAEAPAEGTAPPCPAREEVAFEASEAALDASAQLFGERELRSWVLPHEVARPHLQSLVNSMESGLVVSKEATRERITSLMDAGLDDLMAGPWRGIYARRLEEMAYYFHLQGRAEPARLCAAVAEALASPEGRRMKGVSFLRALVFRAFLPILASAKGAESAEGEPAGPDPAAPRIITP
jgi:hypothetical protein